MPLHINWLVELHPMLVHFPIALLVFAFVLDVAALVWKSQAPRAAALYALISGAVMTVLSVLSGLVTPEAREHEGRGFAEGLTQGTFSLSRFFSGRLVEVHKHWSYVLLALVVLWLIVRGASHQRSSTRNCLAIALGVLTLVALVITGYYGGDLVYGRRTRESEGQVVRPLQMVAVEAGAVATRQSVAESRSR